MRWHSDLRSILSFERVLHENLGARKLSTSSHMAVGGSKEAVYASTTATLHALPVVWAGVAALAYWTTLLNWRRAKG